MKALELADELQFGKIIEFFEKHAQYWKRSKVIEAATMLRQQQAEIEALKDEISTLRYERSSGVYDLAKTLTDEEIMQEWTWKYSDCFEDFLLQFARTILRKASEK